MEPAVRLPDSDHTSRPWRIHQLAPDFRLEDVWGLRTPGRPDDLARAVHALTRMDPKHSSSGPVRRLFALRWKLGERLGWDTPKAGSGAPTLRQRLPEDLRRTARPEFKTLPFRSLYLLEDEWAAEAANRTMHGVVHIGRVPDGHGGYRGQLAVLVKPNGLLGRAYMALIKPFRHWLVYPPLLQEIERELWEKPR